MEHEIANAQTDTNIMRWISDDEAQERDASVETLRREVNAKLKQHKQL